MKMKYLFCYLCLALLISCKDTSSTTATHVDPETSAVAESPKISKPTITRNKKAIPRKTNEKLGAYNGFELVVTRDEEKVHIQCVSGCFRWSRVSVPLTNGRKQLLYTQGTSVYREATHVPMDEAQYEIYIYLEGSDMKAKCLRGCDWEDLSFVCTLENCNGTITDKGVKQI